MRAKYINPYTDFGFKKLFGEEASKPLLIDFLNALLPAENQIKDLTFKNAEQLGITDLDRKAIYDIYCENNEGEKFIVELQKAKQNYFKDRTVYYSTFPIREQAEKGNWNYKLNAVYCIGILDFKFNDYTTQAEQTEVLHTIKLKNQHGQVFYDKLTYIYLEMPNFLKKEEELSSRLDKWLYFLKYLEDFEVIPSIFKDKIFEQAFEKAELARMVQSDLDKYEMNLKVYRDNKAVYDYAMETAVNEAVAKAKAESEAIGRAEGEAIGRAEGEAIGRAEGEAIGRAEGEAIGKLNEKIAITRNLMAVGLDNETIAKTTGLSLAQIEQLGKDVK